MGGLLGGMVGILLSYYIDPLAIPFGVLLGVVTGWWHVEIVQSVVNAYRRARTVAGGLVQVVDEAISFLGRVCGLPRAFVSVLKAVFAKALVGSIVWVVTAPGRSYRWLAAHPMNRARAIELSSYILWLAVGAAVGTYLFWDVAMGKNGTSGGAPLFGLFIGALVAISGPLAAQTYDEESTLTSMGTFYRQWATLSKYGPVGLFVAVMWRNIRYTTGSTIFVVVSVGWGLPLAMLCFLGIYPTMLVLGTMRGFYQLVQRTAHWMCFGVTLVVTGCSWLYFHDQFTNEAVVWSVALITGVASGAATEFVRRYILAFYANTAVGRWMAQPLDKYLNIDADESDFTGYMGRSQQLVTLWFRKDLAGRLLRTICFGRPFAAPAKLV